MTFLVDTNVLSAMRTKTGQARIRSWLAQVQARDIHISVLSLGEIQRGIERARRRNKLTEAAQLEAWLTGLRTSFRDRLVPVDEAASIEWGRMPPGLRGDAADGLIAATAISRNLVVVTRNVKDFVGRGARVLDPFGTPP